MKILVRSAELFWPSSYHTMDCGSTGSQNRNKGGKAHHRQLFYHVYIFTFIFHTESSLTGDIKPKVPLIRFCSLPQRCFISQWWCSVQNYSAMAPPYLSQRGEIYRPVRICENAWKWTSMPVALKIRLTMIIKCCVSTVAVSKNYGWYKRAKT